MSKHTPGPWFIESGTLRVLSDDPRATIICDVSGSIANPQAFADAGLIAAAPDLLAAAIEAKAAMDSIWRTKGRDDDFIYDEMGSELSAGYFSLRDAIAKATGEQP